MTREEVSLGLMQEAMLQAICKGSSQKLRSIAIDELAYGNPLERFEWHELLKVLDG